MKTIKLCIWIWDMGIGGIQKRVRDVIVALASYPQVKIYLLINYAQPNYFGTKFRNSPQLEIIYFYPKSFKPHRFPSNTLWIFYQYLRIRPDVVLTFLDRLSITMLIIRLITFWHACKIVLNEGIVTSKYLLSQQKHTGLLVKWFYPKADQIIVPTKAVRTDLVDHFHVPSNRIQVIPNWTLFQPAKSKSKDYDLIFIGRFEAEKNVLGFITVVQNVYAANQSLKVCLMGEGSQEQLVNQRINQYQLESVIHNVGYQRQVQDYLSRSKILVVTTKNEGMPNVVLEAGMCGVPVVSTHFIGAHEAIINHITGYVVKNQSDMVNKIQYLLAHDQVRKRMGDQARRHILQSHHALTQQRFITAILNQSH